MSTLTEKINVMQAYGEGKKIEAMHLRGGEWRAVDCPTWDWYNYDYRIKVEILELHAVYNLRGERVMVSDPQYVTSWLRGSPSRKGFTVKKFIEVVE